MQDTTTEAGLDARACIALLTGTYGMTRVGAETAMLSALVTGAARVSNVLWIQCGNVTDDNSATYWVGTF